MLNLLPRLLSATLALTPPLPPQFDSSYTKLGQSCKELMPVEEESGQDPVLDCPGPGGLHVRIFFSATDAHLSVVRPAGGGADEQLDSLIEGVSGINYATGTLEWRLANGAPFAIIIRSTPVLLDAQGERPEDGETLEVRFIQPQIAPSTSVNTRATTNANQRARELADQGYTRIR